MHDLREDQEEALWAWRDAGGRGVIILPTGAGKTDVALHAMARMEKPTLVVVPIRDLMYQWHRRILFGLGYDAGIVGDNLYNLKPVTVTTYHSAAIHGGEIGDRFQLVIFDEVHHLPGRFFREGALTCAAPFRMGLTATLERPDGKHGDLDYLVGKVVFVQKISEAKGKTLADYEVVRIPVALSSEEQDFKMENIGEEPIFSEFIIENPETGGRYRVAIRGETPGGNYCSCPDFSINTLGTGEDLTKALSSAWSIPWRQARAESHPWSMQSTITGSLPGPCWRGWRARPTMIQMNISA